MMEALKDISENIGYSSFYEIFGITPHIVTAFSDSTGSGSGSKYKTFATWLVHGCSLVSKIKSSNLAYYPSVQDEINRGKRGCKRCRL